MSSLLTALSGKFHSHDETEALAIAFDYFQQSSQPYSDLFDSLCTLSQSTHPKDHLINCLFQSFIRWRNESTQVSRIPTFDENVVNDLILKHLSLAVLGDFCDIFQISDGKVMALCRVLLREPVTSLAFKRAVTIVVKFQYQLEFSPTEILLPLMLGSKDHLIHLFLDKRRELEAQLLDLLNRLYRNDGRKLWEILTYEFNMQVQNVNKKALGKLAVRYWNLLGSDQGARYPNLACLQHKRTLNYLVNVKYNGNGEERTMSDEAWNEIIEEILEENADLLEYLLDQLVNRNDVAAVKHWIARFNRPIHTLPHWIQRCARLEPVSRPTTVSSDPKSTKCYVIPLNDARIVFVNSMPGYERLLDRLFKVDHKEQEIYVGFDCEWKPMFNNTSSAQQRISIMQIAFPDEIFLLDMLYFFRNCDAHTVQQRLANRLFDDDRVTILCYGFRADASMLASYPVFNQPLVAGKTLLDLSLVHFDLLTVQRDVFPYVITDSTPSKDKGLSELVRLCFGRALDKSEQCSNWEKRPLRAPQIRYAASDAYCLLDTYNFLRSRVSSPDYLRSFRGQHAKKTDQPTGDSFPE